MSGKTYSSTVSKAFRILNLFQGGSDELGISEIAAMAGMPVSSVHRLIRSLEYEGLIAQDRDTRKYYLGQALLMYSAKASHYAEYEKAAEEFVDQLSELTGETVNLSVYGFGQICHIYTRQAAHVLRPNFPLNTPFPVCTTSVGRVFLSHMGKSAVRWVYENQAAGPDMPFPDFCKMLEQFRKQGYALDDEDFNVGLRCVGAPVCRYDGSVLFAMSVSAPVSRMDDEKYAEAAKLVVRYAALASEKIQSLE